MMTYSNYALMEAEGIPQVTPRRPSILVADDDPLLLTMLVSVLRESGFDVRSAVSGKEAVDLYQQFHDDIDIVLLDVMMPEMTGPSAVRHIRKIDPQTPFCLMSGTLDAKGKEELLAMGAAEVFEKPFSCTEIAVTLWRLVEQTKK